MTSIEEAKERIRESKIEKVGFFKRRKGTKTLDLSGLKLRSEDLRKLIPIINKSLPHLESLNLSMNELGSLPERIVHLSNLKHLYLKSNGIISLPKRMGELQKLVVLDVSFNLLRSLPESIGNLPDLEYLKLKNNLLRRLPNGIGKRTNLQLVYLEENPWSLKGVLDMSAMVSLNGIAILSWNALKTYHGLKTGFQTRDIPPRQFRKIVMSIVDAYPNISNEDFDTLFFSLSEDQKRGIYEFDRPLRELGIGLDATNNLSNELYIEISLSQLFKKTDGIKTATSSDTINAH